MGRMKKVLVAEIIAGGLSGSIALPGPSFADEEKVTQPNVERQNNSVTSSDEEKLNQLANVKINQLMEILSQNGYDPHKVFTQEQVNQAHLDEIRQGRAGINQVYYVNNETRDVYINSYIVTTLKYVGFTAVGNYLPIWPGIFVGTVGANINTSRGVIVRFNKQSGWQWGHNGYVWAIIGARSQ